MVEEYTERCKQGINYDPHKRRFGKAKATTTPKADRKAAKKTEQVEATPPPVASSNQLVIPLSATETAHLQLPFEPEKLDFTHISKVVGILSGHVPFKMEDVKRLVGKLAPQAEDFDPIEPLTVQLFNKK